MTKTQIIESLTSIQTLLATGNPTTFAGQVIHAHEKITVLLAALNKEQDQALESDGAEILARVGVMGSAPLPPGPATAQSLLPDCDLKMAAALLAGFEANINLWDAKAQRHYQVPDVKTRLETAKLYLGYRLGMPPQMILKIESGGFKDRHEELVAMARTPSGKEMLLRMRVIDESWLEKHAEELAQK